MLSRTVIILKIFFVLLTSNYSYAAGEKTFRLRVVKIATDDSCELTKNRSLKIIESSGTQIFRSKIKSSENQHCNLEFNYFGKDIEPTTFRAPGNFGESAKKCYKSVNQYIERYNSENPGMALGGDCFRRTHSGRRNGYFRTIYYFSKAYVNKVKFQIYDSQSISGFRGLILKNIIKSGGRKVYWVKDKKIEGFNTSTTFEYFARAEIPRTHVIVGPMGIREGRLNGGIHGRFENYPTEKNCLEELNIINTILNRAGVGILGYGCAGSPWRGKILIDSRPKISIFENLKFIGIDIGFDSYYECRENKELIKREYEKQGYDVHYISCSFGFPNFRMTVYAE